jgi:hypothetical protein
MPSRQRQSSIQPIPVAPVPATIFHRLPQSHHVPLAHLIADLIRHVCTARADKEADHDR